LTVLGGILLATLFAGGCSAGGAARATGQGSTGSASSPTPSSSQTAALDVPPLSAAVTLEVAYQVPGRDRVQVRTDLPYRTSGDLDHRYDVYLPTAASERRRAPVAVLLHGGVPASVRFKDTVLYRSWGRMLAASGFGAVVANWDWGKQGDIDALLTAVRARGPALGLDTGRMCLVGFSRGAAYTVAVDAEPAGGDGIRCTVAFYGDMTTAQSALPPDGRGIAPVLIVKAGQDEITDPVTIDSFITAARSAGVSVRLIVHPTGVHAFDARNSDPTTRRLLAEVIAFLQQRLGRQHP
jgi:acetyl esterase/lipase